MLVVDQNGILSAGRGLYRAIAGLGDCEILLVVPARWPEYGIRHRAEPEPLGSSIRVKSLGVMFGGKSHRAFYPSLGAVVRQYRPHILFVNAEPESFLAWQASTMCSRGDRSSSRMIFISWRNIDYPDGAFPYKLPFINARAEHTTLRVASYCVAHNETAAEIFRRKGFNRLTVIPPAVDTHRFVRIRKPGKESKHRFIVGYIGRLVKEKGIHLLIEAMKSVPEDLRLHIVGGGSYKPDLEFLAHSLGVGARVKFFPSVVHADVPSLLSTLDLLVLPSLTGRFWKEQFGRVLIEAMACGVPVVGSDSGEIPKVIADAGLVFAEGNIEQLKDCLMRMYSEPELRAQAIKRGFERVEAHFSIKSVAPRWHTLFMNLGEGVSH